MADNFNLRSFLTENKLTKNAQLLKEEESQHSYEDEIYNKISEQWDIAGLHGAPTTVHCNYGRNDWKTEKFANGDDAIWFLVDQSNEGDAVSFEQARELAQWWDESEMEEPLPELGVLIGETGEFYITQKTEENLDEAQFSDSYDTPAAKKVHGQLRDIVDIFQKSRNEEEQEVEAAITAAEQETGSQVTPTEKSVLLQQARWIRMHDTEMEREGTENKKPIMKETKLTAKERRLVEMVQKAMKENTDISTYTYEPGEDNNERDPGHGIEQAQQSIEAGIDPQGVDEGGEMPDETVIPEYNSIDELMKSIDHGTNKVAEEHKIQEMKKIADALRTKAKKMEESEHAAHINPKDLMQLTKDAAALDKAAAKYQAAYEKQFNKKEKAAAPKKEKKETVEALQEGTFDLRKFLAENRK